MAMYDTIHLWLSKEQAGNKNLLATLPYSLNNLTKHDKENGQLYFTGSFKNYKAVLSDTGISLRGSLAKYFLPDNFHTLTRSDSKRAIEQMADELHLPIMDAKVTRIDFAQNFLMRHTPEAYYSYLGESQYYKRKPNEKSLYYTNGLRTKLFYYKVAEGKASKMKLPDVWNGQNVLRYELRYTARLSKEFNLPEVTASTLHDEKFYMALVDRWIKEYEQINKLHQINLNLDKMSSPKDFRKALELFAVNVIGQDKIIQMVEDMRLKNTFDKPEYYSRLKKDIKELCKTPDITTSSEMVAELDKKIDEVKRYYR